MSIIIGKFYKSKRNDTIIKIMRYHEINGGYVCFVVGNKYEYILDPMSISMEYIEYDVADSELWRALNE